MGKKNENIDSSASTKLIKFIITPIGTYGLSYFSGSVAAIESELADKIVKNGHAEYVNADLISPEGAEAL
jgi:hypothetical protein